MRTWAIVPVKPFNQAKSRLSPVLNEEQRQELVRIFLEHTLGELNKCACLERILVISSDEQVWESARQQGAFVLEEEKPPGLNHSLRQAAEFARQNGAEALLIVPTDLPFIKGGRISELIQGFSHTPAVLIAPDQHKKGTNLLLVSPVDLIPFQFGENSFQLHQQAIRECGCDLYIVECPSLALDVDEPQDLELLPEKFWID